ncbi:hypothetical protein M0R45_010056 [Rubus argutus]|uniref:NB-ARC domain-containing protein n=1 Tax=Rubus argutus TaxID=59490 RepID=A0AAW1Y9R8_RUBAR
MVDICISIAGKVAEYTVAPVLRQFGYLIYYKSNVEDLTEKVTSLTAKRDDVLSRVETAKRNLETISREVDNWLDRVEKTLQDKDKCFEEGRVAKATTCCPNLKVRHSLSRKATKMAPKVDVLLTEGNFPTISCPAPAPKIEYPCIQYYEDFTEAPAKPHEGDIASSSSGASNPTNAPAPMDLSELRLPYTKDLLKSLQDDKINMIGISGIFREIDTVSTKEFIKRMKNRNIFEEVVIADVLDLKLENGSLVQRARAATLDSKTLLLVLADVREVPDLEAIRISPGDDNKRCKIILISQVPNVFSEMTNQTDFVLLLQSPPVARPVEFESRISVIRDVMDALTDDESNPIVLCEFTQEPDLVKIQGKIAKDLGLELEENDDRAAKLRERISGGTKRVLVILDNVWTDNSSPDQLTLWEVGIPISRDPKCCKVLVSSREEDIFKEMKTKKNIPIGGLPQKDAWNLFKKVVGSSIESDPELRPIAEQVLKRCDGLPVAITTVGRALKGESIRKWGDALRQLRKACPEDVPGVIKHVYGKIEFSYECLPSEQAKSCFLLCRVFPKSGSFPIEYLFRLGFGLGLFKGIDSIAEGRDHIKTLVDTLKSRFLLLDGDEEIGVKVVKMHDVVRDVAIILDCANLKYLEVKDCDALEYFIHMTSLMEHTPRNIFPVLNNLRIKGGSRLKEIFHGDLPQGSLQKLKTIELRDLPALTYVWKVESQSGCVGNLAHVDEIDIQDCQSLEAIFGLVGSGHHEEELALEINFLSLTRLCLADLPSFTGISNSNCMGMARLPEVGSLYPNSLTVEHALFFDPKVYFPVLRKLYIQGLRNWKEIWNSQCSPNSFCELTHLDVRDCDKLLHLVPTHMQNRLQKLETIFVFGCSSLEEIFEVRRLNVNEGDASTISQSKEIPSSISQPDQGMQINNIMDFKQSRPGFQNLTVLVVTCCHSLRYLLSPSIAKGLVRLEVLNIVDCEKIEEIVAAAEGEEKEDESILPRLKHLSLQELPNLGSFSLGKYTFDWPLVRIDISKCDKMKNFCSGSLSIPREVDIRVRDCGENLEQELNNCMKEI